MVAFQFVGLAIASMGAGMLLHNLIRMSPVFVPASLTLMLIIILFFGGVFFVSFLLADQLIQREMNPTMLVIASGIGLMFLLIGTVLAWIN